MPKRLSNDNVSSTQRNLLNRVKKSPRYPSSVIVEAFMDIATDEEINDGTESLHPDWLNLYQKFQDRINRYISPEQREVIRTFFDSFQPFDSGLELIDPQKRKVVFLLGAGASKPEPSRNTYR